MDKPRLERIKERVKMYRENERSSEILDDIEFMITEIETLVEENDQLKKRLIAPPEAT